MHSRGNKASVLIWRHVHLHAYIRRPCIVCVTGSNPETDLCGPRHERVSVCVGADVRMCGCADMRMCVRTCGNGDVSASGRVNVCVQVFAHVCVIIITMTHHYDSSLCHVCVIITLSLSRGTACISTSHPPAHPPTHDCSARS